MYNNQSCRTECPITPDEKEKKNRLRLQEIRDKLENDENDDGGYTITKTSGSPSSDTDQILEKIFFQHATTPLSTWDSANTIYDTFLCQNTIAGDEKGITPVPPSQPPPSSRNIQKMKNGNNRKVMNIHGTLANHSYDRPNSGPNRVSSKPIAFGGPSRSKMGDEQVTQTNCKSTFNKPTTKSKPIFSSGRDKTSLRKAHVDESEYPVVSSQSSSVQSEISKSLVCPQPQPLRKEKEVHDLTAQGFLKPVDTPKRKDLFRSAQFGVDLNLVMSDNDGDDPKDRCFIDLHKATEDELIEAEHNTTFQRRSGTCKENDSKCDSPLQHVTPMEDIEGFPVKLLGASNSSPKDAVKYQSKREMVKASMDHLDTLIKINPTKLTSHKSVPPINIHFLLNGLAERLGERRVSKASAAKNIAKGKDGTSSSKFGHHSFSAPISGNQHHLIYQTPSLEYPSFYDDWINSNIVLDALDNEQDDLGERISSFVLCLSDIRQQDVNARFLESLNILLDLHNDLRCPMKQHLLFWKAHCLKACPGNLVSILSRIALLSKSRNILLTILRSVLNRAVLQDKWLWDYAHSLHHGHRVLVNPSGPSGNLPTTMPPTSGQEKSISGFAQGDASQASHGRSFLSQYKADTSKDSYLGQTPKQIRESARKTLNFAKTSGPSFSSPLLFGGVTSSQQPISPPQVTRESTFLSVVDGGNIIKPSQMTVNSSFPIEKQNAQSTRPDSGISNMVAPLKPSLALQQITEDDEDDDTGDDDNEDSEISHNESFENDDEDDVDQEEIELIEKRKEQFRTIQRLSGLSHARTETPVTAEVKHVQVDHEPVVINKDDIHTTFLSCTAETVQNLVGLWKSSLPWKIEKFIFGGVDYMFELSIYPPEFFLVQSHDCQKEKSCGNEIQQKKKNSRKGKPLSNRDEPTEESDDDLREEMRSKLFQPKMSLPLS